MSYRKWVNAVLLRVEQDGTHVYRKKNAEYRVAKGPSSSWYPPGGRAEMYKGHKDPRDSVEFAEAVRDRRSQGFRSGVKPGPQTF